MLRQTLFLCYRQGTEPQRLPSLMKTTQLFSMAPGPKFKYVRLCALRPLAKHLFKNKVSLKAEENEYTPLGVCEYSSKESAASVKFLEVSSLSLTYTVYSIIYLYLS